MNAEPTFEESQAELERIVERLERGDVELEELTRLWERGEELYRRCADQLSDGAGEDRGAGAAPSTTRAERMSA